MDTSIPTCAVDWVAHASSPEVLSSVFGAECTLDNVSVQDITATAGGLTGSIVRVHIIATAPGGSFYATVIGKATRSSDHALQTSMSLGLAREALFYAGGADSLARLIDPTAAFIPHVYAAEGDMALGHKVILMEDMQPPADSERAFPSHRRMAHLRPCVSLQSGYFFGPHSILNRALADSLPDMVAPFKLSEEDVTLRCVEAAANLHAAYWGRIPPSLLERPLLRAAAWLRGSDAHFESSLEYVAEKWAAVVARHDAGEIVLSPMLKAVVDRAVRTTRDFPMTEYTRRMAERVVTVVHGDFHPANIVVVAATDDMPSRVVLLDWEVVGVGSGPQDVGQFLISHSSPATRRDMECRVVAAYDTALRAAYRSRWGADLEATKEAIAREVIIGGVGRWAFLFAYIAATSPPPAVAYFHDQLDAFITDHAVGPDDVVGELRL